MSKMQKYLIKEMKKQIYVKLDDIMGNPMIYDFQKTLLKLTVVLIIGVFFVIRGSTAPLINQNPIIYWLFYSNPNGDKTMYNIGTSIIAAYLFYLVQVYIPEKKRVKRKMFGYSEAHKHEIFILNQYIIAWKQFFKEEGKCQFCEFEYSLNDHYTGVFTKETYEETIVELVDCLDKIITNPGFSDSDSEYTDFIINSRHKIKGHLLFMDDHFPRWSDKALNADDFEFILSMVIKDMERIQNRLSYIEKYYLKVLAINPYSGKSKLQKLVESLQSNNPWESQY